MSDELRVQSGQVVALKLASHYYSKVVYFGKHAGPVKQLALRALLLLDLGLRMGYRGVGVARGYPPDARQRLAAYGRISRALLTMPTGRLVRHWRAMGAAVRPALTPQPPLPQAGEGERRLGSKSPI